MCARPTSSELWNQPRCWSLPSRYKSAGQREPGPEWQYGLVARSGIEPDVEDVVLPLEGRPAAAGTGQPLGHELGQRALVPRVGAVLVEHLRRALDDLGGEEGFAAARAVERRDRHAPRSLARDAPVGTVGDHVEDAVAAPRRYPIHLVIDRAKRRVTQCARRRRRPASRTGSPSIRMNHCEVARKITGLWHRQQCGYVCWYGS